MNRFGFAQHYFLCLVFFSISSSNSISETFDESERKLNSVHKAQKESMGIIRGKINSQVVENFDKMVESNKNTRGFDSWQRLSTYLGEYLNNIDSIKIEVERVRYFSSDDKKADLLVIENHKDRAKKLKSDIDTELSRSIKPSSNSHGGVRNIQELNISGGLRVECNDGTYQVVYRNLNGNHVSYSDGNGFVNQDKFLTAQSACK